MGSRVLDLAILLAVSGLFTIIVVILNARSGGKH